MPENIDNNAILKRVERYRKPMIRFLRELVAIPAESCQEQPVIERIRAEMEKTGAFDRIWIDGMGNLLGKIGRGKRLIAIDAHVDTVGVGNIEEWKHDPYKGKIDDTYIWGRGAGDQRGAIPAMVYGARVMRDLGLNSDDWSLLMTFTVMEEDCDGLCWQYIVKESGIRPEVVVVTDSTNATILRGQRGRMEIGVTTTGRSCHGSMPHKGVNAIYKAAKIVNEIEKLNEHLKPNAFLGKGTITVSYIDCKTPSMCAVPNQAYIHLDRRLTLGENKALALREVRDAVKRAGVTARVGLATYERESWKGLVYPTKSHFPTWVYPEEAPHVQAAVSTCRKLFNESKPKVGRWTFSTNAVSISGMFRIPVVGYGPAEEAVAHTVNDRVPIEHLIKCAAFYASYPGIYCEENPQPVLPAGRVRTPPHAAKKASRRKSSTRKRVSTKAS